MVRAPGRSWNSGKEPVDRKIPVSTRLDHDVRTQLHEIAEAHGVTTSKLIGLILQQWLAERVASGDSG